MARPRRRTVVLVALGAVALWAAGVAWLLLDARSALAAGRDRLTVVRDGVTPSSLLDPATGRALDRAGDDFARARSRLRHPVLAPLRVLPVIGRHVRAGDRVVATSQGATRLADDAVRDLQDLTSRSLAAGPERLAVLEDLAEIVARTERGLGALDPGSADALAGPLAEAVTELDEERDDSRATLRRADRAVRAITDLLAGPSSYLLLGANNAEMRNGSGMFLSAAPLELEGGRLALGEVRPTQELVLPAGSVPVTGDLAANWPWLDGGRDLRNLALTANFPQSAALAAANWAQVPGGGPVDGVIAVDVDALRSLLAVVGPVEVDGVRYSADTVRGELLREQYRRFGDDRVERRDQLGEVATVVFERIEAGEFELDELATALIDSVARRNLVVWSAAAEVQEAWSTAGADGHLEDRSVSVALLNRSAHKLDSYVETSATLDSEAVGGDRTAVTLTYRIENRAPASGPRYLLGPNIDGLQAGEHRGIVVVNLPAGAADVRIDGARQTLLGTDGPTVVVAGEVALLRGDVREVEVRAVLPAGLAEVVLEPSARISRTRWTVDGRAFETDRRRTVPVGG
ncbi:MAG TPA: DUF4012 domain-containing protein [Aquihabitans sp.]|jgi:hypothetical protein|nr:DUF4012 domain-containing protein [Aquihabitans sp.]